MDEYLRLLAIEEKLKKASDRIKTGKRIKKEDANISTKDAIQAIKSIMSNPGLSSAARKNLTNVHKHLTEKSKKEEVAAMSAKGKPLELGQASKQAAEKKQQLRDQIAEHVKNNSPTIVKELGNKAQYQTDQKVGARPRSTASLTGPVKERMATGEGIAIADKQFGAALDAQRQLKEKENKIKESKGPSEVITVPKRYHEDDTINELMRLKSTIDPKHHPEIDKHISIRENEIKGAS